jgi:predicted transcriptional regulator
MACVNGDGTLTVVARQVLTALLTIDSAEEIRTATGLPMYRIRSGLREMATSGLIDTVNETRYTLTARGRQMIDT